jgi:hypothetical protein
MRLALFPLDAQLRCAGNPAIPVKRDLENATSNPMGNVVGPRHIPHQKPDQVPIQRPHDAACSSDPVSVTVKVRRHAIIHPCHEDLGPRRGGKPPVTGAAVTFGA